MTVSAPVTILGGLPVVAFVAFGKDADTPNGAGEYWAEVEDICWMKKDGSAGKSIPQHLIDKAEVYDPYFANLTESVSDHLAMERWEREHPDMRQFEDMVSFG